MRLYSSLTHRVFEHILLPSGVSSLQSRVRSVPCKGINWVYQDLSSGAIAIADPISDER